MSEYKIVFSDLDGTLLNLDMTVSEENRLAIRRMTELGVSFVASSGRSLSGYPRDVRENGDIRYLICSNGTAIFDKSVGDNIYTRYLEREDIDLALSIVRDYDCIMLIQQRGDCYADGKRHSHETYLRYNVNKYFEYFIDTTNILVEDFEGYLSSIPDLEMITVFFSSSEELIACRERLRITGRFKLAASDRSNIEIFSADAGKGAAVGVLSSMLGVDVSETIAVGDSTNDLTMIEAAGLGLAMSNAFDEVKEGADAVICRFDENSAKYILEQYIE